MSHKTFNLEDPPSTRDNGADIMDDKDRLRMKVNTLTQKQHDFANNYVRNGFNAYRAAIDAGYSHHHANTNAPAMVNKPKIKDRIVQPYSTVEDSLINKLGVSLEWRVKRLKRIIEAFIADDSNHPLSAHQAKTGLAAIAEINKLMGDYSPDRKFNVNINSPLDKLKEVRRVYEEY